MNSERFLVLGATSAIAHAVARRRAARGARLHLVARRPGPLADNAADLLARGAAAVTAGTFDALDTASLPTVVADAWNAHGGFDTVLVAWGTLPDQAACEASMEATLEAFDANARSVVAVLGLVADRMRQQSTGGVIGVVSSVAGERGRASNYVYGAAKAAVTTFASGLRHRLRPDGIRVVTILPGFVDTPMTAGLPKGGPLWASADRVAADIDRALTSRNGTLWTPWFWRIVLGIVRALPEPIFLKTKL